MAHKRHVEITAREFHYKEKNQMWFMGVGLIILVLAAAAGYFKDYLLAAAILAAGIAIFRLANLKPPSRRVMVSDRGITIDDRFLGFHQLRSFWVVRHPRTITIYLERIFPKTALTLLLTPKAAEDALEYLKKHLPHHHHRGEPLADRFSRVLGL